MQSKTANWQNIHISKEDAATDSNRSTPALELHMMIGISGSGKSTIAEQVAKARGLFYIGSDALRFEISGSEDNQECSNLVFRTMETLTKYCLRRGQSVILDATFLTPERRAFYLASAAAFGATTFAHVMREPIAVALARNAVRTRRVPEHVIARQFVSLKTPTNKEFEVINYYPKI